MTSRNPTNQQLFKEPADMELDIKTRKVSDKLSECFNVVANEPSLAFFRIQEHVRKTVPQLVEQKHEVQEFQQKIQGSCFDTEYATNAVKTMEGSVIHFQNIQELLKNAIFHKQQIDHEKQMRGVKDKSGDIRESSRPVTVDRPVVKSRASSTGSAPRRVTLRHSVSMGNAPRSSSAGAKRESFQNTVSKTKDCT